MIKRRGKRGELYGKKTIRSFCLADEAPQEEKIGSGKLVAQIKKKLEPRERRWRKASQTAVLKTA